MNEYLFDPEIVLSGPVPTARIRLDPRQPYLSHHDVGTPLLGTAMSLEAMAESAAALCGKRPTRITQVVSGADCLVPEQKTLRCTLESDGSCIRAALLDGDGVVFTCVVHFDPLVPPAKKRRPAICNPTVAGDVIYACFFHGPAFQVVERAWLSGSGLASEMHVPLPPLLCGRPYGTVLPVRTLEFCLQSSGLLDAASRKYMSVPLGIGGIELYCPDTRDGLWAVAEINGPGSDICAYDGQGEPVLAVWDYRTKPMPYESKGFSRLCRSFEA